MPSTAPRLQLSSRRRVFAPLLLVLLAAIQVPPLLAAGGPREYIVGPNDVLAITVFDQPQLTGKYLVQADGTVTFPLLGRLKAGGLSMQQVEDDVRHRLTTGGYLTQPQVGVAVDQYRSQQVFVMGEVRQPGNFQFTGSMDVIEALARAGATTDRADEEAVIVRAQGERPPNLAALERATTTDDKAIIRVNLRELQMGGLAQNVALQSGDTIFVPRARSVFVSGQVRSAGEYVVRKGMTVRQVLALAGGVTDRGSSRRIQIIRHTDDAGDTTIAADLQDPVRPGDTIVVRDRIF